MTCSGQFEEQWPRVKQQPKVDRRTRANGRRASTSSPTCALSLSQLTARTARAGSRWHRPSCFPSATCREISRHLSEGHVCEKKGVKKPVNRKITPQPTTKLGHYCCARDAHPTCSVCSDRCVGTHWTRTSRVKTLLRARWKREILHPTGAAINLRAAAAWAARSWPPLTYLERCRSSIAVYGPSCLVAMASDRVEGSTLAFLSPSGGFGHDGSSAKAEGGGGALTKLV